MRILATKARASTNEINNIINKLYNSIDKTVVEVETNGEKIDASAKLANEAKLALDAYIEQ